jgi:hypothetical protein
MPTPSVFRLSWNTATLYAAANGACAKVVSVRLAGCREDKYIIETSDDMTAPEIAAVEAAILAVAQVLVKES